MNDPLVAVIVAVPSATPVITPLVDTVALVSSLDDHLTADTTALVLSASDGTAETVMLRVSPTLMLAVF